MAYEAEGDNEAAPDDKDDKKAKSDWVEVHTNALLEYERDYAREQSNIDDAYEDLRFRRGRLSDQWTPEALEQRKGRPCHVVNKLPQFIRQVTGDMRKSRPSVKVVPVDSGADVETAEVRGGMIRYVENRSHAKHIYTTAGDSQVTCGIGHFAIDTEYAHAGTFNQEIRIVGIEDSVSVLWDCDSFLPTREDAEHCFVPIDMSRAKFKENYPDAVASGFDTRLAGSGQSGAFDNWHSDDFIRVVKYWKKKPIKRTLALLPDGSIEDLTDQVKDAPPEQVKQGLAYLEQQQGARIEQRDSYKICRYLITMAEVLEESDWPGMHIPVVPLIGEEVRIGRDVYRHGIVRYARDLQRMENYYASAETEVVALQPKAPWLGTKKNFQDHYDLWETANTDNHPFLEFTPDALHPQGPTRVQPPVASQAIAEGKVRVSEDMKAVIGIYDASLGAKSNETSGVAIARRDAQGDTGTYVYIDNFALGIERAGQIINDLFPHIYDTQRTIRILGDDGKADTAEINKPQIIDGVEKIKNDMTSGSYDVMIEQGPGYATKREQAQEGITEFIRAFPPAAPLIGDIYAKIMDFPHAEEIGERLEEVLPPPIKAKIQQERAQADQQAGKPPSPEYQQEQQAQQQAQQEAQQAKGLQMAELKAKADEAEAKARKAVAEADRAETEAKLMRANHANATMDHLRAIETHDHQMARDHVQHHQDTAHKQDKHEVDMTVQGLSAGQSLATSLQGAEKHDASMAQGTETHEANMKAAKTKKADA